MISRKSFDVPWDRKVSPRVREIADLRGYPFIGVCQPQHLFRKDIERRLPRVADPRDPWWAGVSTERFMGHVSYGIGATPDEAVLAALPSDLRAALRRCESAVDSLRDCLQK